VELRSCPEAVPAPQPPKVPTPSAAARAWNGAVASYDATAVSRKACDTRRAQAYELIVALCAKLQDAGAARCLLPKDANAP